MLSEKHNDEKLVIILVRAGLIAYHFWQKINETIIVHNRWYRGEWINL